MCMGTVVQTASQSVGMFIGARFLIGFGHSFAGESHIGHSSYYKDKVTDCRSSPMYSGRVTHVDNRGVVPVISRPPDVDVQRPLARRRDRVRSSSL